MLLWSSKQRKIKWMPLPRTERGEALYNPYCGLYSIYRFYADNEFEQREEIVIEDVKIDPSHSLCLIEINLVHFNQIPLSGMALNIIERIFLHFICQNKQMVVRFVYDWDGKGIVNEPNDITIILRHMEQLSLLLKKYTKHIYILQGLFIGSWGEMHNSRYLSERSMTRLAKQLYLCSGENTQIALRCPSFWRMVFKTSQPLDDATAYLDIQKARFSLFNDGIMASDTDLGTYGEVFEKNSTNYSDKWVRKDELSFQRKLCSYISNGGEVINECNFNDVPIAIDTLKDMRISYLHSQYDEKVLDKWKAQQSGVANTVWRDKTAFEYVAAHLGYRFTIEDVSLLYNNTKKGQIKVGLKVSNKGFAPCYHRFDVNIIIRTPSSSEVYVYPFDTDTRKWFPEETIELEKEIPINDLSQKNYTLCIGISDPVLNHPVQIANTFSGADHTGIYNLGNFVIDN